MTQQPSRVVQENIDALIERERAGRIEHGDDMDRTDFPVEAWLAELISESLDSANYGRKLQHMLPKLVAAAKRLEGMGFAWADGSWQATCTCPSGDGSLRWPCPVHTAGVHGAVAKVGSDHFRSIVDWLGPIPPPNTLLYATPVSAALGIDLAALRARVVSAIERITSGTGQMRVPADLTDPDLVLADVLALLDTLDPQLPSVPRPMHTAPRDGTMLRLLVQFDDHATEDTEGPAWTIGHCSKSHPDDDDNWQFAGWCWDHDHFTEGKGTPVGWLPLIDASPKGDDVPHRDLVPGVMRCAKCAFQLHRTNLYLGSGTTGPGDSKTEPCPNGCGPLWPVTWQTWATEGWQQAERYFEELRQLQDSPKGGSAACERIAAMLYQEATDEPWTVAGVEHDGPDRAYYRELARRVLDAALVSGEAHHG